MNLGEFFVQLGVKSDKGEVDDFSRSIRGMTSSTIAGMFALTGLSVGFVEMFSHTINLANGLGLFRSETGLSVMELQKWQQAAQQFGISSDAVTSSIMGISDAITKITKTGGGGAASMAFGRLGVSWSSRDPFAVMKQLRERYQGMKDKNEFRMFASQLGVSPEMSRLFALPEKDFNAAMKTAPVMNDASMKAMQDFQKELARFSITAERSLVPVLQAITPYLGDLAKELAGFIGWTGKTISEAKPGWQKVTEYGGSGNGIMGFYAGLNNIWYQYLRGMMQYQPNPSKASVDGLPSDRQVTEWMDRFLSEISKVVDKTGDMTVHQHISVDSAGDVDKIGSRHLTTELTRTNKHINRQGN